MDARMNVAGAVRKLVRYGWEGEEKHYWECEPKDRRSHIFKTLRFLNDKFNCGMKEKPEYRGWKASEEPAE